MADGTALDAVPEWPKIVAVVREDGTAEVTVNGTSHPVHAADVAGARVAVLEQITENVAGKLGRAVRVRTNDPDGEWNLVVHPDGTVDAVDQAPAPKRGRRGVEPTAAAIPAPTPLPEPVDPPAPTPEATQPTQPAPTNDWGLDDMLDPTWTTTPPSPTAAGSPAPADAPHAPTADATALPDLGRADDQPAAAWVPAPARHASTAPLEEPPTTAPAPHLEQPEPVVPPAPAEDEHSVGAASTPEPVAEPAPAPAPKVPPTLSDLLADRPAAPSGPAQMGWQGTVHRLTGGLVSPAPSPAELGHRTAVTSVQRSLDGPKTVVVVNPKGGAHKTTATLLIAATFGIHRGGYTLAWDNNETRGTLGWRATPARHQNTAVDLLRDLKRFQDVQAARVGDLDNYVRSQGSAQFDVLASDEDAASAALIDEPAFLDLHATLSRFYRLMVIDTGNNMRASNWQAAVAAADQLVIVSTVREDTAQSAAWLVDGLRATGNEGAIEKAVTVLSAPARTPDPALKTRLHRHFGQLTRAVVDVPYDQALVAGGPITYDALTPASREAWLRVTAAVADGL